MKILRCSLAIAAMAFAPAAFAHDGEDLACPPAGGWLDARTGAAVAAAAVMDRLAEADVVLLGESHGFPDIHLWQATTAAAVASRRNGAQYGYEMLPRKSQSALDDWAAGKTTRHEFLKESGWLTAWGVPAAIYEPILRLPRIEAAPAIALNVDRALVRRVANEGWAAIAEADRLGVGDPAPALPAYEEKLAKVIGAKATAGHGGSGKTAEKGDDAATKADKEADKPAADKKPDAAAAKQRFIEAQLVWDRAFAEAIQKGRAARPDKPVIAFMGRGHVEHGHGVQHQLQALGETNVATAVAVFVGDDCALPHDADEKPIADFVYALPEPGPAPALPVRPKIGVYIQDAKDSGGAEISRVRPESPADKAGFKAGDVVVVAAGQPVKRASDLGAVIRSHNWGAWLPFKVKRGEEELELVAKLPALPAQ